jgi:hypothetical protein
MSGIGTAVGTIFSSVASTAANVGSAIMGVGSSLFTAGAATGGSAAGLSGMFSGTLGNVITGALTQAAIGAVVGGGISALTGGGFGRGAMMGGIGGAISGGLMGAAGMGTNPFAEGFGQQAGATGTGNVPSPVTPTQTIQTGNTSGGPTSYAALGAVDRGSFAATPSGFAGAANGVRPPPAVAGGTVGVEQAAGGGFGQFMQSPIGANILTGIGNAGTAYLKSIEEKKMQAAKDQAAMDRLQAEIGYREGDRKLTIDSYKNMPGFEAPEDSGQGRQTPSQKYARMPRYKFIPGEGIVQV